jgi:chromosome segregation ATPase
MKSAIKRLLSAFGLAPAAQVKALAREAQDLRAKAAQLEERLSQARADADSWKRRQTETADALAGWKQAAAKADAETERIRGASDRLTADLERAAADAKREQARSEEWRGRADKLAADAQDLRVRLQNSRAKLEEAERAAATAHEHLMAMEVKLDLLEAAAQVLDLRTRDQAVPHPPRAQAGIGAADR